KLNPAGSALVWSTYLGGARDDRALGLTLDAAGNVYLTRNTPSTDYPLSSDAASRTFKGTQVSPHSFLTAHASLTEIAASGSALVYSSYLGGSGNDWGIGIALDPTGAIVVSGGTSSRDFPITSGVVQSRLAGAPDLFLPTGDAFLTRFAPDGGAAG